MSAPATPPEEGRQHPFLRQPPSALTLAWVATSVGAGGSVIAHRRLTGGVNSAVHQVSVAGGQHRSSMVLRQYPPDNPALNAVLENEVATLGLVARSGLPVPEVLAADLSGADNDGAPSLLMTRLTGGIELGPDDHGRWLERVAEFAARLHAVELPAPDFDPWQDSWIRPPGQLRVPTGARRPTIWRAAFDAMESAPPRDIAAFVHGDFLPVNLLWSRGRITGLLDWNGIHRGSPAIDLGHFRRYLTSVHSPDWAEELRSRYESITGRALSPWWDLYALLHHTDDVPRAITRQVAGRRTIDEPGMTARVEESVAQALARLG